MLGGGSGVSRSTPPSLEAMSACSWGRFRSPREPTAGPCRARGCRLRFLHARNWPHRPAPTSRYISMVVVQNDQALVELPSSLVDRAAPPHNPLLEQPNPYAKLGRPDSIVAEPPAIEIGIEGRAAGSAKLRLINASGKPARMTIHAPSTPHFKLKLRKRGLVMPGMAEEVLVLFTASDSEPRHYHDQIRVQTETGELLIPLAAFPTASPTDLGIPSLIDLGPVTLGSHVSHSVPLQSPASVGFEISILRRGFVGTELNVEPLTGTISAGGTAFTIVYSPVRLATARMLIELRLSQPGFTARRIEVVGSCAPGHVRQEHFPTLSSLASLASAGSERGGKHAQALPQVLSSSSAFEDALESEPPTLTASIRSVLLARPTPSSVAAAAAVTDHRGRIGGDGGGGDSVSRAMAASRRETVGRRNIPVKYPVDSEMMRIHALKETHIDGYSIPRDLDCQIRVNALLNRQRGKLPVAELRSAITQQKLQAERDREAVEKVAASSLESLLQRSLAEKAEAAFTLFEEVDVDGLGRIDAAQFSLALPLLRVPGACEADMHALFATITDGAETLDYEKVKKPQRRLQQASVQIGASADASAPAGELDLALQPAERSRQVKEMLFLRQMTDLENFEKAKEIKALVARGAEPCPTATIEATRTAREAFYVSEDRERRRRGRERREAELGEKGRATISDSVVAAAKGAQPTFDIYSNDSFALREQALATFKKGVRTALLQRRAADRLHCFSASLEEAGLSLKDCRSLVSSRAPTARADAGRFGAPVPTPTLSLSGIEPFAFPTADTVSNRDRDAPLDVAVLPLEPAQTFRRFALRVPRRYKEMGYMEQLFTAPGDATPSPLATQEMRVGAAFEASTPQPTGDRKAFYLEPMPPSLLTVRRTSTPGAGGDGQASATAGTESKLWRSKPPPRVYTPPPPHAETDVEFHLRARPVPANEAWLHEPIGLSSSRTLLLQETISSRCSPRRGMWAEAAAPLPKLLSGASKQDLDHELSDDESDTDVELQAPTEERLRQIFELPDAEGEGPADADPGATPAAEVAPSSFAALAEAAEAVLVSPERIMPVDHGSELARAEAALQADLAAAQKAERRKLGEALDALNTHIEDPRFHLACRI